MRTTITIDSSLEEKLKKMASRKALSRFINDCLREHFEKEERKRRQQELERAYARAASQDLSKDFDPVDIEDWPE
jgi:metal-responsive CopG/Arc/MetJ family transcriptional regulator